MKPSSKIGGGSGIMTSSSIPGDSLCRRATSSATIVSRRQALVLGAGAVAIVVAPSARAQKEVERHGMSAFGDLKYPADFNHFDYVNPDAPKGGTFSHIAPSRQFNQSFLTFNSLNAF